MLVAAQMGKLMKPGNMMLARLLQCNTIMENIDSDTSDSLNSRTLAAGTDCHAHQIADIGKMKITKRSRMKEALMKACSYNHFMLSQHLENIPLDKTVTTRMSSEPALKHKGEQTGGQGQCLPSRGQEMSRDTWFF